MHYFGLREYATYDSSLMIEVWMVIVACLAPHYTDCEVLETVKFTDPERCQLMRPAAAAFVQLNLNDGWLTFTRCELVNPEENGRLG